MQNPHDHADQRPRVGMALLFYPRGGSAQVAGYLSRALQAHGWDVSLASGSLGAPGERGHAATFFDGLDVHGFAFDDAVTAWEHGQDPMDSPRPMHPSFEDRDGVPDRIYTSVSPQQSAHAVDAWATHLRDEARFATCDVLHLHHVGILQHAARIAAPNVPIVSHLHGTDLKLLDAIERGVAGVADQPHAQAVATLLRDAAKLAEATICISPHDRSEAVRLLDLDPGTMHVRPNGVDVDRFTPADCDRDEARARWRRWLVDDPQGWDSATHEPGSIRYDEGVLDRFVDPDTGERSPVLLYVGRFLDFKRVPLLVRAYARARDRFQRVAPLVVWGGAPGEWEGEHPHDVARELGVDDVFFVGWRGHDELPSGLQSSAALVAPSVDEPFGQVYLEAMACGLPVVATTTGGPPSFVNVEAGRPDGWLVAPDDIDALADAMVELVNDPDEREQRGGNAVEHVRGGYAWSSLAHSFIDIYDSVRR